MARSDKEAICPIPDFLLNSSMVLIIFRWGMSYVAFIAVSYHQYGTVRSRMESYGTTRTYDTPAHRMGSSSYGRKITAMDCSYIRILITK